METADRKESPQCKRTATNKSATKEEDSDTTRNNSPLPFHSPWEFSWARPDGPFSCTVPWRPHFLFRTRTPWNIFAIKFYTTTRPYTDAFCNVEGKFTQRCLARSSWVSRNCPRRSWTDTECPSSHKIYRDSPIPDLPWTQDGRPCFRALDSGPDAWWEGINSTRNEHDRRWRCHFYGGDFGGENGRDRLERRVRVQQRKNSLECAKIYNSK